MDKPSDEELELMKKYRRKISGSGPNAMPVIVAMGEGPLGLTKEEIRPLRNEVRVKDSASPRVFRVD